MATFSGMAAGNPFVSAGGMNFSDPAGSYNSAYQAAAATNRNLYAQAMSGFQNQIAQAQAAQQQTQGAYGQLQRGVMRRLAGSNRANLQDIADQYTALSGQMSQQMIDRGLGNTTIQQSVQRGVAQDYSKERTRSENSFAQLMANYQSQLGLARLGSMQRGNEFMSGLQGDQMRYLASIQAPYPDPGMYAQLAMHAAGGGLGGFGMPGPSPTPGPVGGLQPNIFGGGGGIDFSGGGGMGGGFGGWASGYGGGYTGQSVAGGGYDPFSRGVADYGQGGAATFGGSPVNAGWGFGGAAGFGMGGASPYAGLTMGGGGGGDF